MEAIPMKKLEEVDIARIDKLATLVANSEVSEQDLQIAGLRDISKNIAQYVTFYGLEATHKMLDVFHVAINETDGEDQHEAFLMALDMKISLKDKS